MIEDPAARLVVAWIGLILAERLARHLSPISAARGSAAHVADVLRVLGLLTVFIGLLARTAGYFLSLLNSR